MPTQMEGEGSARLLDACTSTFGSRGVAQSGDRNVARQVDVLDRVEDLYAAVHRALEGLAAADQAGAAGALVDHGGAYGLGQVGVAGGGAAAVDQAGAAQVTVCDLIAAEVDRMVGGELAVDLR